MFTLRADRQGRYSCTDNGQIILKQNCDSLKQKLEVEDATTDMAFST